MDCSLKTWTYNCPYRQEVYITQLFFASDILLFCEPNLRDFLNIKYVLLCFQATSGLKINLAKYELVNLGEGIFKKKKSLGEGREASNLAPS